MFAKSIVFFWCILLFFVKGHAQNEDGSSLLKDLEFYNIIKNADELFKNNEFADAIYFYEQAQKYRPDDVQIALKLGISMVNGGKVKSQAIPYLKKAVAADLYLANYYLGKAYHSIGNFALAKYCYEVFKLKSDKNEQKKVQLERALAQADTAAQMLQNPVHVHIKNLGVPINSDFSEYAPMLPADLEEMYFTSRREGSKGMQREPDGQYYEDIWYTKSTSDGWSAPENLKDELNSNEHDAMVSITPDGTEAILYRSDPYSGADMLYSVKRNSKGWSSPLKLSSHINSNAQELSACLSPDAQSIIFSSNRKGGYGGSDLYISYRKKNGVFGPAENLGPIINTMYDEESPFLHADGKCLYFSSKGHAKNMGGFDVFMTCKTDSGKWSLPKNLGYPINTPDDDLYFVLAPDKKTAFFSGIRDPTLDTYDIYMATFAADTSGLTLVKGMAQDTKNEYTLQVNIQVFSGGNLITHTQTTSADGHYRFVIPSNVPVNVRFTYQHLVSEFDIPATDDKKFRIIEKKIRFE